MLTDVDAIGFIEARNRDCAIGRDVNFELARYLDVRSDFREAVHAADDESSGFVFDCEVREGSFARGPANARNGQLMIVEGSRIADDLADCSAHDWTPIRFYAVNLNPVR
jgi:hypothetical protein